MPRTQEESSDESSRLDQTAAHTARAGWLRRIAVAVLPVRYDLVSAGTWRGTVTIAVNPGDPNAQPATSGSMQWTFEVVPQTNQQTFRTTIRSEHTWLVMMTTATTALTPVNTAPAQIRTQGQFDSPRGCRGTFGSVGVAESTRIDADFTATDCQQATFTGRLVLTKN